MCTFWHSFYTLYFLGTMNMTLVHEENSMELTQKAYPASNQELENDSGSDYEPSNEEISSESSKSEHENIAEETVASAELNKVDIDLNEERKRRIKANEMEWSRNKNKRLRIQGEQYLGIKKDETGKRQQNIVKTG